MLMGQGIASEIPPNEKRGGPRELAVEPLAYGVVGWFQVDARKYHLFVLQCPLLNELYGHLAALCINIVPGLCKAVD